MTNDQEVDGGIATRFSYPIDKSRDTTVSELGVVSRP
jgi:hypothetical protein